MTTRSTFGDQPLGRRKTAPAFSFGSSSREQASKVFVSQEHTALATAGMHSPGPAVYLLPSSVGGKQPDGRRADPPAWAFGSANRFRQLGKNNKLPGPDHYKEPPASVGPQVLGRFRTEPLMGFGTAERKHVRKVFISSAHQKTDFHGLDSPGPAMYGLKPAIGPQWESKIASAPEYSIGGTSRAQANGGGLSPGPAYTMPQSIGPQPDSKKSRSPTPAFGTSTREHRTKIYLGPDHEIGSYGKLSPGPAAPYTVPASVGTQVLSNMREAPRPSFSKANRWASYEREQRKNTTPGPGAY